MTDQAASAYGCKRYCLALLCGVLAVWLAPPPALAVVPLLGRWQHFAYSTAAVNAQAAQGYSTLLEILRAQGQLDDDPVILGRIRHIAAGLIEQAIRIKPSARAWDWKLHTTSAAGQSAECMAGGKLIFGSGYIRKLNLNDGELATLIGHEIAHAIAEHQREEVSEVFYRNPAALPLSVTTAMARLETSLPVQADLSSLSRLQESEADELGMLLAHRAGWPARDMVSFYWKIYKRGEARGLIHDYPSAASRLSMARALAALFTRGQ